MSNLEKQYEYIQKIIQRKKNWESVNEDFLFWAQKDLERVERKLREKTN